MSRKIKTVKDYKIQLTELEKRIKIGPLRIRELTDKQKDFLDLANDPTTKMIFVYGPAGTSKTWLAVLKSLQLLSEGKVNDIIYVRSVVESSDSKMGFLKGQISEKMAPYLQPLEDKMREFLFKEDMETLMKSGRVQGI